MELLNATPFQAAYTQGLDKTGREHLLIVVKATYSLPLDGSVPRLMSPQVPLTEADQFTGEPGFSATLYESDFALYKPRCDVLLNGSAYAPNGVATSSVEVGLSVSTVTKVFRVLGDRYWYAAAGSIGKTRPTPFTKMNLSYDLAFGGVDDFHPDESKRDAYLKNPVGKGFHRHLSPELVNDTALPNTEAKNQAISSPLGNYRPMSFGVIGRGWPERAKYAGTYDQQWVDHRFPFLPADFDDRYYQAAPEDQQCDHLKGGEQVHLMNLTPNARVAFTIPTIDLPVVFFRRGTEAVPKQGVLDTLLIEPDLGIFTLTWRCSEPLKRNIFEVPQVLVGQKSKAWWRAKTLGKAYHPSLASAVSSNQVER